MKKLSKDEIEVHKVVEADNQDAVVAELFRQHQEALRPRRHQVIDMTPVNMGDNLGFGINPKNEAERVLLEACAGLSFAEKKQLLDRHRRQ